MRYNSRNQGYKKRQNLVHFEPPLQQAGSGAAAKSYVVGRNVGRAPSGFNAPTTLHYKW